MATIPKADPAILKSLDLSVLKDAEEFTTGLQTVPDEVKTFVEEAHEVWRRRKDSWFTIPTRTVDEAKALYVHMKNYSDRRDVPLTIRQNRAAMESDPGSLVVKVTDRINKTPAEGK